MCDKNIDRDGGGGAENEFYLIQMFSPEDSREVSI